LWNIVPEFSFIIDIKKLCFAIVEVIQMNYYENMAAIDALLQNGMIDAEEAKYMRRTLFEV